MNCDDARKFFDLWIEDRHSVDEPVLRHVENCAGCSTELQKWERIYTILRNSPTPSPPKGLAEEILAVIPPGAAESSPHPTFNLIRGPWLRPALALAAMLIIGICVLFLYQGPFKTPDAQKSAAISGEREKSLDPVSAHVFNVNLHLPDAESVALVGDFNEWNKKSHLLSRDEKGNWSISLNLKDGYFQYQLLVDGRNWIVDPNNSVVIPDGFGGYNSGVFL
jgi:hypothetical protein